MNDGPVGSDLQTAINASTQPDDVVKVSGRCLVHDLTLDKTLTIQGGWDHDLNMLDPATYTTTLDARRLGRVINVTGSYSPTIENLFIIGGIAVKGGAIYNAAGNPVIRNNRLRGNVALYVDGNGRGGGIYNHSGNPIIQDNLVVSNTAYYGGAIYNNTGNPRVQSNSFLGNWTYSNEDGGGIYNYNGSPIIEANTFQSNSSYYGGAIYHRSGNPTIENNSFLGNTATYYGGGIGTYSGNPTIRYNTFFSNTAANGGGGGIYSENGNPTIWGNIVVSNTANNGGGIYHQGFGLPILDQNNVWDNQAVYGYDNYYGIGPGPNDISENPRFVDPQGGDLHLAEGSPCIDAGDPEVYPGTDREGDPRPMGLGPDLGADEFRTLGISKTSIPDTVAPGELFSYTVQIVNLDQVIATSVVLTDVLPAEVEFLGYQGDGIICTHDGSSQGGIVQCNLTDLDPGASKSLTLTVAATNTLNSPIRVTNAVTAASSNGLVAVDQATTWLTWCAVRLNDGPVGSDIQAAINASNQPSDVIKVSGRCLVHDILLNRNLTLQGGWNPDFNDHDARIRTTTLDAQWLGRVLEVNEYVSPIIEDFSIVNGLAANGGGVVIVFGSPIIQNNIIRGNGAYQAGGGGISSSMGDPIIRNNVIHGNLAYQKGAGIITGNGNPTIEYNTVMGNSLHDSYTSNGSGLHIASGYPTIHHNIVVSNSVTAADGVGGIYHNGLADVDYNNVWHNEGGDYFGITPGLHDISSDPLFVDADGGDLHLAEGSPCIDSGNPADHPPADREGDPRALGLGPDMGADEFRTLGVPKTSSPFTVAPGETFTYTVQLVNLSNLDATNVVLTDVLPLEVELLGYQSDDLVCTLPSDRTVNCTLASLPTGAREGLTLTVQAADPLPSPIQVSNIVTATSSNGLRARDQAGTWISWCKVRLNDGPVGDDLQAAINASTQPTDVVKVSGRCLVYDIGLYKVLTLQGGWQSDFSVHEAGTHLTTLDAQRMSRVLEVSGSVSPIIEDFLFTGGLSDQGGGIYNGNGSPTIQNNIFLDNAADQYDGGGGIYNNSGNPIIQGNSFQGNAAYWKGGAISNDSGSPTIKENLLRENSSERGGGIYNNHGGPTIQSNTFQGNVAYRDGGGIYTNSGSSTIVNNFLQSNAASSHGGGLYSSSGSDNVHYNSFHGNSAGKRGGGVYTTGNEPVTIRNNIVVSNSAQAGGGLASTGTSVDLDYNNVWGNLGLDYWGTVVSGPNDISADPLFLNPDGGDLHLTAGSPCIDAADPNDYPDTDYEGDPRPIGTAPDIGADEFLTQNPASLTETDHSWLVWDESSGTYTRIYPDGKRVHFNPDGTHDYTLEPSGRQTQYTYNLDGAVTTMGIILPGEDTPRWEWTFLYTDGKVSSIVDPAGRTTILSTNRHNQLTSITDPDGVSRQYTYNQDDLLTQFTDEVGDVTTYGYDDYGRVSEITESPRSVYNQGSGQISVVQEVREFIPSDTGYVLFNNRETGDPDNPGPYAPYSTDLWDRIYFGRGLREGHTNRWGYWLDETDGEGRTTYYQRDDANNLTRIDYPDGTCTTYTYDENGNRLTETQMEADLCLGARSLVETSQILTRTYTYEDRFNQIKTWTDPLSNTITYVYDYEEDVGEAGNLIRIEYPPVPDEHGTIVVPSVSFTYNEWGQMDSETDPLGIITKYIYTQGTPDEDYGQPGALFAAGVTPVPGLLTQVIRDFGGLNESTTSKDFDGSGYPQVVIGSNEAATTYSYDAWGRVLTEQNAVGIVTKLEYDGLGNLVKRVQDYTTDGTTGRNVVTRYTYDPENRMLSERTAAEGLEVATIHEYDINGKLATQTDGNGKTTTYDYDEADQLVYTTDPLGYTTIYSYTLNGQLEAVVWPDGTIDKSIFDRFGRLEQEINDIGALDLATTYSFDLNDNVLAVTDPAGAITCFEYDALNRPVAEIKDCGGLDLATIYQYDLNGKLITRTDPQGVAFRHHYDTLNREIQLILDDGGLSLVGQYEHDGAGNLVQVTDEQGNVFTLAYDELSRVTHLCEDVTGLNLCSSYSYDRLGNRVATTDPNGITSFTRFNDFGMASEIVADFGGMAAATRYDYDNSLNLTQIEDTNGNTTSYGYSPRNKRVNERYPDGTTVAYSHNERGWMQDRTDQDGNIVTYFYDGAGRMIERDFSTGGTHSFTFDPVGQMTGAMETAVDHESLITVAFNSLGDVISTSESIDGQSWSVHYDYDYPGSVYTLTYPSGVQRVYTLDPLKRVSTVQNGGGISVATYDYRDVDGYGTLAYANGTSNRTDFDALGRITSVTSDVGDYRYGYDAAGNRTYMKRAHSPGQPADVYQYDGFYQVEQVWYGADAIDPGAITTFDDIQGYNQDMLSNRLEVNDNGDVQIYLPNDGYQLTNSMNRYEQVDDRVFAYDGRGNTLGDGLNTYSYDILNRQTGISGPASNAEYIYNAVGWRIAKMVDGVTTYYAQDINGQVLEELSATGATLALFTYGIGIDQPLTMEIDGSTYYYHRDAQGSITEVTDTGGNLVERYTYDIYGTARLYDGAGNTLSESAIGNPYLYTARRYDPESGNYYFRARYYSPSSGRFLQMDPIGYVDGMNLYSSYFVINATDPSGLKFSIELFNGDIHAGIGGSLSVEVEFDFKDCCTGGTMIEDGKRTYTFKMAATIGLGLGAAASVVGTGVSLGVSGPALVGEGTFSAKNTECGGPVNTLEHCRSAGVNLGFAGKIGAFGFTVEAANKVQGTLKLCGAIDSANASIEVSFCGTLSLELNQQIGPYKSNIWKHKATIDDQCKSLIKRSWALPT